MISMTASSVPSDVAGVKEILSLIADPAACAKRLEELQKMLDQINAKADEARFGSVALDTARAKHAADAKTLQQRINSFDTHEKVRSKQLSDHEDVLSARQKQLQEYEKRSSDHHAQREADLTRRETDLKSLETTANATLAEAKKLKAAYESHVAKLESVGIKVPRHVEMAAEAGKVGATMSGAT